MANTTWMPNMDELYDFVQTLDDTQRKAFYALIGDMSSMPSPADRLTFAQTLNDANQRSEFFALFGSSSAPKSTIDPVAKLRADFRGREGLLRQQILVLDGVIPKDSAVPELKDVDRALLVQAVGEPQTGAKPKQSRQRVKRQATQTAPAGAEKRTFIYVVLVIVAPIAGGIVWHFVNSALHLNGGLAVGGVVLFIVVPAVIVIYKYLFSGPNYAFRNSGPTNNHS